MITKEILKNYLHSWTKENNKVITTTTDNDVTTITINPSSEYEWRQDLGFLDEFTLRFKYDEGSPNDKVEILIYRMEGTYRRNFYMGIETFEKTMKVLSETEFNLDKLRTNFRNV